MTKQNLNVKKLFFANVKHFAGLRVGYDCNCNNLYRKIPFRALAGL